MKKEKKFRIPIIYFHSVAPLKNHGWQNSFLTLNLDIFNHFLKYLVRNNYKTIFLDEYFDKQKVSYHKEIVITFDDGYLDNWVFVFPLLKKYNIKATIFINPETVDRKHKIRPTLYSYWSGKIEYKSLHSLWGFLSWDEMRFMEQSGLIDIQSHTLTHTKYFISDKIIGFHSPFNKNIYPLWNVNPELKPYYINNPAFPKLLPYGTPLFEDASAVIAKKVKINPDFIGEVTGKLKDFEWGSYNFDNTLEKISVIYRKYKEKNRIIESIESQQECEKRVFDELYLSKKEIESELNKSVHYCCWPHGDNNESTHTLALSLGYKATTIGKYKGSYIEHERIGNRFGIKDFGNNKLSMFHLSFNIRYYQKRFPQYKLKNIYHKIRYKKYRMK